MITLYLLWLRQMMVIGATLALMPSEFAFDVIEGELERRGVDL